MSNHDDDKNLDKYLTSNSEISSLYDDTKDTGNVDISSMPSIDLDNSILAAAKREVNSKPLKAKNNYSPFSSNYLIPVSTAASILIVVAVVSFFPSQQIDEQATEYLEKDNSLDEIVMEQELSVSKSDDAEIVETKLKPSILKRQKLNKKIKVKKRQTERKQQKTNKQYSAKIARAKEERFDSRSIEPKIVADKPKRMVSNSASRLTKSIKPATVGAVMSDFVVNDEPEVQVAASPLETEITTSEIFSGLSNSSGRDSQLYYNKRDWESLPSEEWLIRIRKIAVHRDESAVKDIIKRFNKKFPDKKIDFKVFLEKLKK